MRPEIEGLAILLSLKAFRIKTPVMIISAAGKSLGATGRETTLHLVID